MYSVKMFSAGIAPTRPVDASHAAIAAEMGRRVSSVPLAHGRTQCSLPPGVTHTPRHLTMFGWQSDVRSSASLRVLRSSPMPVRQSSGTCLTARGALRYTVH